MKGGENLEIFSLLGGIFIDNDEANKSIAKTEEKAQSLGSKFGEGVKTAAKWGAGILAGAGVAAGALLGMATKTAAVTDNIDKMSQKLGMSRQGFQEWDFILSQSGTSIESMKAGMKTVTNQFDDLSKGGKTATAAFGELGLKYEDLAGMTQEQIFEKVVTSLQGVEDTTKESCHCQ